MSADLQQGDAGTPSARYQSIFLEDGWAHQKYYGWRQIVSEPGLRVLTRARGPLRRALILAHGLNSDALDAAIRRARVIDARTDLILHDFDDAGQDMRKVAGRDWRRATAAERLLNIATFVIDLARDDDALLAAMSSDYRRKIRKAREAGVAITAEESPSAATIDTFLSRFHDMADERGLARLDRAAIENMFSRGDLTLFSATQGGEVLNMLTAYRAGDKAIFLHGVGGDKRNDGSGQYLHFEVMRQLRARGLRWYDLGGLASTDEANGIFRFKKGFGGELVRLGCEYVSRPPLVRAVAGLRARLRG